MDINSLSNYIKLCKRKDFKLINDISVDLEHGKKYDDIAKKYNVSLNEVIGMKNLIEHGNELNCSNPLEYVYNKYNTLKGGKGGTTGKSGKGNLSHSGKRSKTHKSKTRDFDFNDINEFEQSDDHSNSSTHPSTNSNDHLNNNSNSNQGFSFFSLIFGDSGHSKNKNKTQTKTENNHDNKHNKHKKDNQTDFQIDVESEYYPVKRMIETENKKVVDKVNNKIEEIKKITTTSNAKLEHSIEQANINIEKKISAATDTINESINESIKSATSSVITPISDKLSELELKISNLQAQSGGMVCPCCDCAKDGYIFTESENQKCM